MLESVADEYQLARHCPWPKSFDLFDSLVRFITEHTYATKAH